MKKLTFKQRMMLERESLIIETVNHLLATKGYDAMTVDEIADTVGIAKASLYRHFPSKEALGMAALVDIMHKALEIINQLNATDQTAIDKLKALTQWAMRLKLAQKMPNLPSENSQLRELLIANDDYTNNLVMLSDSIGEWIEQAQAEGKLQSNIPGLAILYTLYARACDPVLGFLRSSQLYDDDEIIAIVTRTCFEGLT
ncbi:MULTISPECIES: TetR/AcrR family transcriptional regulator [Pseudomonadota]|jgi:AcrR family transcriptional regulator|uniref:TetR/AcrR family transcriptional regulator n=1 Tax=Faucicola osloensis TaxID=34062 RepID=A0AAW6TF22_FAUOS|nr:MULTISPECIES: TetR/AcrR family transcriptional regulator [Pseudomonadota]NOX77382.1 TetR/AcrR family transcriptional regulator [Gammaproteobacteria bacterium]MBL7667553.1 TetR/AcrR family transcriptional regulator [Moraxella osloensis]MDI4508959.1 TetR/AcrR family transcriptional regulator [Moraxella osloensis]NPA79342.1 TetR/AcrR family transcriptional regulator [Gammaproteobacteria bacterium]VXB84069.1 TetR/AcrR family transcriptional regulator [Enhydrobacter sp. 8BJ]